jgi:hypothetical protein
VLKRSAADLRNGWLARHGELYLTDERIVFVPTVIDRALGARRREMTLDQIAEIERCPASTGDMLPGGRRPRMRIHTRACIYELMVSDLDAWIDNLERAYRRRALRGNPHTPKVTRAGHVNLLLEE